MKFDISRVTHARTRRYTGVRFQQGRVVVDADLNEQAEIADYRTRRAVEDLVGASGVPLDGDNGIAFQLFTGAGDALIIEQGRMYVGGLLIENGTDDHNVFAQDDCETLTPPVMNKVWLFYVDAWEEGVVPADLTADDDLADPALGGVEPSGRVKVRWQVRAVDFDTTAPTTMTQVETALSAAVSDSTVTLTVMAPTSGTGSYQRPVNQLYRVEIHSESPTGVWTWKWSRENGTTLLRTSVATPATIDSVDVLSCTVDSLGPDGDRALAQGDWVEVFTSADRKSSTRAGRVGLLRQVHSINDVVNVLLESGDAFTGTVWLRKWDGKNETSTTIDAAGETADLTLEEGLTVRLTAPATGAIRLQPGDYWLIPLRAAEHDVLGDTAARLPDGPIHRTAPLGFTTKAVSGWGSITDLRYRFRPAVDAIFETVSGDGQIILPGQWSAKALVVNTRQWGESVTFAVATGDGTLALDPTLTASSSIAAISDADGNATVWWKFPADVERTTRQRYVTATWGSRVLTFTGSLPSDYDYWVTDFKAILDQIAPPVTDQPHDLLSTSATPGMPGTPNHNLRGFNIKLRHLCRDGNTAYDALTWDPAAPDYWVRVTRETAGSSVLVMNIDTALTTVNDTNGTGGSHYTEFQIRFTGHAGDVGVFVIELRPRRWIAGTPNTLVPGPVIRLVAKR